MDIIDFSFTSMAGAAGIILSFVSAIPYAKKIAVGKVKTHAFTWLIWSAVTSIAAAGQWVSGAGAAAWCTAAIASMCLLNLFLCATRGFLDVQPLDWLWLILALCAIPLWMDASDPTAAMVWITFIEVAGFMPAARAAWNQPWNESLSYFLLSSAKYFLAILAIAKWSIAGAVYPCVTFLAGSLFCVMLISRRRTIAKPAHLRVEYKQLTK